jgi:hypothetical protein
MKDEMMSKFTEKALQYLNSAEAFVGEQVPAYIDELLTFKIFEHLFAYFGDIIVLSIVLAFTIYLQKRFIKYTNRKDQKGNFVEREDNRELSYSVSYIMPASILVILTCSVLTTRDLMEAYKAYKAPRVYLVEYFNGKKR